MLRFAAVSFFLQAFTHPQEAASVSLPLVLLSPSLSTLHSKPTFQEVGEEQRCLALGLSHWEDSGTFDGEQVLSCKCQAAGSLKGTEAWTCFYWLWGDHTLAFLPRCKLLLQVRFLCQLEPRREAYPLVSGPILSVRLANVSPKQTTIPAVPTRAGEEGLSTWTPKEGPAWPAAAWFEACFHLWLAWQELGSWTTACLGGEGGRQRIIYICLKERKGMLGKGRKKEKSCLRSRGLLAPSQQSSELGITVSILQRRNQASKQLSKLTKATKLVSEELRIKATDWHLLTCKDSRALIPMRSGGSRISKTKGFGLVIVLEKDPFEAVFP